MKLDDVTLLILGVGGNVSQGILKALATSSLKCKTIGACVNSLAMGLYVCDHAVISPLATDPHFIEWLTATCHKHQVTGIVSGVEPVLKVLAAHQAAIELNTGAKIIVSPTEKLLICDDKLTTADWLRDNGLNYPQSSAATDPEGVSRLVQQFGYRLFAKPRCGKGSQGVMKIESETDLTDAVSRHDYVIQEYLGDAQSEFTAATFSDHSGDVRGCIVFTRQLLEGTTVSARVVDAPEVRAEVLAIAQALKPVGPCNMQLRLHKGRPVCFEINLRYSGTTPIRAQLGFNDTEAGVRHYILEQSISDLPQVTKGVALRFWNEIYINPEAIDSCQLNGERTAPGNDVVKLETFARSQ